MRSKISGGRGGGIVVSAEGTIDVDSDGRCTISFMSERREA